MIKQLRPFYSREELARVYDHVYDHTQWGDHIERVAKTTELLDWFALERDAKSVADLSCGDGAIVRNSRHEWESITLGDYVTTGPIELALLHQPDVDMFVLSETLEHVEEPDVLLHHIRNVASNLVLTTPYGEVTDENPEHYWGWDDEGVRSLAEEAGWRVHSFQLFTPTIDYYTFQMWAFK